MICMAGLMFFLYIGFNYAFHGEGGIKETIWEAGNKTITNATYQSEYDDMMSQFTQGFGIAFVICFLLAIVFFLFEVFHHPPEMGRY